MRATAAVTLVWALIASPFIGYQMRRALDISAGDVSALFNTPFTLVVYIVLAAAVVVPLAIRVGRAGKKTADDAVPVA